MDGFKVDVGGFMSQYVGVRSTKNDHLKALEKEVNDFNSLSNTEIHFSGSTSLDNGIDVSFKVELEGDSAPGNSIDESYLTVSGDFGKIELGNNDGAAESIAVRVSPISSPSGRPTRSIWTVPPSPRPSATNSAMPPKMSL